MPLSRKISSSIKAVIGTKNAATPPNHNGHNGEMNVGTDDDLEMVYRANKASKAVVADGSTAELIGTSKKEKAADCIDKTSRVLFPLLFIIFNVVYWVYFSLTG